MIGKPGFRAEFSARYAVAAAMVNDVPVQLTPGFGSLDVSVPVAQWLASGDNRFGVRLEGALPNAPIHPLATASVALASHQLGRIRETEAMMASVHFGPGEQPLAGSEPIAAVGGAGPISLYRNERRIDAFRSIRIDEAIPRWKWLDSPIIADTPANRASLLQQYRHIHRRMSERVATGWHEILLERTVEYRIALHATPDDMPDDYGIVAGYSSDTKLDPLEDSDAQFRLYGNGRLAEWVRWDDEPLITRSDAEKESFYRFIFRQEAGAWIVTR